MITTHLTIICDECEYEEDFEDVKLLAALRQLREIGWIIRYVDGNAICPSCATLKKGQLNVE